MVSGENGVSSRGGEGGGRRCGYSGMWEMSKGSGGGEEEGSFGRIRGEGRGEMGGEMEMGRVGELGFEKERGVMGARGVFSVAWLARDARRGFSLFCDAWDAFAGDAWDCTDCDACDCIDCDAFADCVDNALGN